MVELPEGAYSIRLSKDAPLFRLDYRIDVLTTKRISRPICVWLPASTWQIVGMLSEVTEKQAGEIIDEPFFDNLVALQSAIEAAGFIFSTDECPNQFCENGKIDIGYGEFTNCKICDESRVLSRERCLLLRKI